MGGWSDDKEAMREETVGTSGAARGDVTLVVLVVVEVEVASMGGGRFCFMGDTRPGSTGGGADSEDKEEDGAGLKAGDEKTGTGGTFFGDTMNAAGSDVLEDRLAGDVIELAEGEKGEEGMGEGGTDSTGRVRREAGTGGGATSEPVAGRVTIGGGGGGTLVIRPCCFKYDVYIVPLLSRSSGGLGFLSSVAGSDVDLDNVGCTTAGVDEGGE